mgnify:FL=1
MTTLETRTALLREVLANGGLASDEFGVHCVFCDSLSKGYRSKPKHEPNCLLERIKRALEIE